MKKSMILALALLAAPAVHADGFRCQTVEGDLNITVYHQTSREAGTRNAAIMVLSDPAVSSGRKTIAKFTDAKGTVSNSGASYEANVDLRMVESRAKGEYLVGTRLGNVDRISLELDFSYDAPVQSDTSIAGTLTVLKRSGGEITREVECSRYLKN